MATVRPPFHHNISSAMNLTEKYWYLENADLFKLLCPHKFAAYKESHTFQTFKKNDFVYHREQMANKIYLIASGKVRICTYTQDGGEVVKAVLSKGDIFGELAILGEEKREEYAQSLDNQTQLCPMTVDTLHDLMREHKSLNLYIYKLIGLRIKKLERKVEQLVFKDVKTRLVEFVKELAEESGKVRQGEIYVEHIYTQKDIADLIGTSRPTLNALLQELSREGVLESERKKIILKDPNYFKVLAS